MCHDHTQVQAATTIHCQRNGVVKHIFSLFIFFKCEFHDINQVHTCIRVPYLQFDQHILFHIVRGILILFGIMS
jgi:hypothetical protein